jgi:hypothetical protein
MVFLVAIVRPVDARVADSGEDPVGPSQIGLLASMCPAWPQRPARE